MYWNVLSLCDCSFLVTIMGLLIPWSLSLAIADIICMFFRRPALQPGLISILVFGDWVCTSTIQFIICKRKLRKRKKILLCVTGALVYVSCCILLGCKCDRFPALLGYLLLQCIIVQPIPTLCCHGHLVLVSWIQLRPLQPVASSISVILWLQERSCSGHLIWKSNVIVYRKVWIVQNLMLLQQSFRADQFNLFIFAYMGMEKNSRKLHESA